MVTETPTYPGALRILSQRKRRIRGWPAGAADWNSGYLARLLRAGSHGVLYVQAGGHNPTGATMPLSTRETIGRVAAAGWLVVADETMRPLPTWPGAIRRAELYRKHPGSAFMELQFYGPGYVPRCEGFGCAATQYCAAMTIDSLSLNQNTVVANTNACNNFVLGGEEPVNWAVHHQERGLQVRRTRCSPRHSPTRTSAR